MIYLTKFDLPSNYIRDAVNYFDVHLSLKIFDDLDKKVMLDIDGASIVDINTNCIKTKFGVTSLENLSAGCKTILVYNYLKRNKILLGLNITECGSNALECLFSIVDDNSNNIFVLQHCDSIWLCSDRDYNVDGKVGINLWNLLV